MALTIDNLEIQIEANAQHASSGIEALATTLEKLKTAVGDSSGLTANLTQLSTALKNFNGVGKINLTSTVNQLTKVQKLVPTLGGAQATQLAQNLNSIATSLGAFSTIPKVSIAPIANGIQALNSATTSLDSAKLVQFSQQMRGIASGLAQLNAVEKGNIGSVVNQLRKIPEVTAALDDKTITAFATAIQKLVVALAPLAQQMESVSRGFGMLPSRMRSAIKASNQVANTNGKLKNSYNSLATSLSRSAAKFWTLYYSMQRVVNVFAEAFNESNEYIESLNLFKVSLGDTAEGALGYAETVRDAMGIDVAEWITNQGVFTRMATGFGIVSDQAELMGQNLTQLAYDMSSFFNVDVQTAMEKLQSGMSGQIKGLKAWGYNLSVAALQETALSLGIEQSVRTMTEAQKAQLRYITLIQRSNGIMGDMAKTIVTPANSMRILNSQLTQLKRAFGDVISVLLVKVIPYVQAFVELATEAANALAKIMGFEIKELPTNNLEMASDVIDGIGDNVDDTTDSVSELKKQLMGFDELNILKSPDADDGGDGDSVSYDLGVDLPEYDFLAGLSGDARERIDEIKESIKGFFDDVEDWIPVIRVLTIFFSFKWIKKTVSNIKNFVTNMTKFQKACASVIGFMVEFTVVKDAIYDLNMGTSDLGETLLAIVPVTAVVGTALTVMLGPIGLLITALGLVAGAAVGFVKAEADLRKELANATFYDDFGASIEDIANAFTDTMNAVTEAKQPILDALDEIADKRESVKGTVDEIMNIGVQMDLGATSVEEAVPKLTAAFEQLYKDTYDILQNQADLIWHALAGSTGQVLTDLGYNLGEYVPIIGSIVNDTTVELEKVKQETDKLLEDIANGTAGENATAKLNELLAKYSELAGTEMGDIKASLELDLKDLISGDINWETDDLSGLFGDMSAATDGAEKAIQDAYNGLIKEVENLKKKTDNAEYKAKLGELVTALQEGKAKELADVAAIEAGMLDALQKDLVANLEAIYDAGYAKYGDLNGFQKAYYNFNPITYGKSVVDTFVEETLPTITEAMEKAFGDDAIWADVDFAENILSQVFDEALIGTRANEMKSDWDTVIDRLLTNKFGLGEGGDGSLEELASEAGQDYMKGLAWGVMTGGPVAKQAAQDAGYEMNNGLKSVLGIHSPSTVAYADGVDYVQGLANGITDSVPILKNALDTLVSSFKTKFSLSPLISGISGLFSKFIIGAYASGGFPAMGEMFIARERGPELVGRIGNKTAVANNSQITAGIASAVYNAMLAARENNGGGQSARIFVQIGERVVGEAAVSYINGQIVQTGESPIYA